MPSRRHKRHEDEKVEDGSHGAFEPPQTIRATVNYRDQTIRKAKLTVPYDLTEAGLPKALKQILCIPQSQPISIYRYSKSNDTLVLMDNRSEYDAVFRSLKVKRKFSFTVTDVVDTKRSDGSSSKIKVDKVSEDQGDRVNSGSVDSSSDPGEQLSYQDSNRDQTQRATLQQGKYFDQAPSIKLVRAELEDFRKAIHTDHTDHINEMRKMVANMQQDLRECMTARKVHDGEGVVTAKNREVAPHASFSQRQHQNRELADDSQELVHSAICNECEELIRGLRYKCLECSDFDLCGACVPTRGAIHPSHGFVCVESDEHLLFNSSDPVPRAKRVPAKEPENSSADQPMVGCRDHHYQQQSQRASSETQNSNVHAAYCDNCNARIIGTRYKCFECPDFDLCETCHANNNQHNHSFATLQKPADLLVNRKKSSPAHANVYCDGPLCKDSLTPIRGIRFKCGVCPDVDFCERCEALPDFEHSPSHPLVKFRKPLNGEDLDIDLGRINFLKGAAPDQKDRALWANGSTLAAVEKPGNRQAQKQERPATAKGPKYSAELIDFYCNSNGCLTWTFKNTGDSWDRFTKVVPSHEESDLVRFSYTPFITLCGKNATFTAFAKAGDLASVPTHWSIQTPDGERFAGQDFSTGISDALNSEVRGPGQIAKDSLAGKSNGDHKENDVDTKLLSARQISSSCFQGMAIWKIENNGDRDWPAGVYLAIGDTKSAATACTVPPNETAMFSVFTEKNPSEFVLKYKNEEIHCGDKNKDRDEKQKSMESSDVVVPFLPKESPDSSLLKVSSAEAEVIGATSRFNNTTEDDFADVEEDLDDDVGMFSDTENTTDTGYDMVDISEFSEDED